MKKILFTILLLLVLYTVLVFILVPAHAGFKESSVVSTTGDGFDSCLHNLEKWKQWFPGKEFQDGKDSQFVYEGSSYKLLKKYTDGGIIQIKTNDLLLNSRIQTYTKNRDSITVEWQINYQTGYNPFTRPFIYRKVAALKDKIPVLFDSLCLFAGNTRNIYGFPIERTTFTEVLLLSTRFKSNSYPNIEMIYNTINNLRKYLVSQGATEKYYPMINTKQTDGSQYETMVAISIDKKIPVSNNLFISQMVPMENRFLATELTGGPAKVEEAHQAVERYMRDHTLSAPARPFEILVTERNTEPDTTKWKTKIFYPSM